MFKFVLFVLMLMLVACPTQPPTPPVILVPINNSTASSNTPTISGTGQYGVSVSVFEDQKLICRVITSQDNTWACIPTTGFTQQQHSIYAIQTDDTGYISAPSEPSSFNVRFAPLTLEWNTNNKLAVKDASGKLSFKPLTYSDIDDISGGFRYLTVTFEVANLGAKALENLTLHALATPDNVGGTSINTLMGFPNTQNPAGVPITDAGVAQSIVPTHGSWLKIKPEPDPSASDFQGFSSLEIGALQQSALNQGLIGTQDSLLEFGYGVRSLNNTSHSLPVAGKGYVAVAFKVPRKFTNFPKPYTFKLNFVLLEDGVLRVTRGLGETTSAALARAVKLGTDSKPAQLTLIGSDSDAPSDPKITLMRLASLKIGTAPTLLPFP